MQDFSNVGNFMYYKSAIFCHHMGSFKLKMHQNPFFDGGLPLILLRELMMLP